MDRHERLELLNAAVLIALFVGALLAWPALPEVVPIHFDSAGEPTYTSEKSLPLWLGPPVVAALVWLVLVWIVRVALRSPARWNVPDRSAFLALSEEARAPIIRRLAGHVAATGLIVTLVLAGLQAGIFLVATGRVGNLLWFAIPLGVGGSIAILALGLWRRRWLRRRIGRET